MSHMVAAIDVHKRMLAVVIGDTAQEEGPVQFQRRKTGTGAGDLQVLTALMTELGVQDVVMESTAQYWRPVWQALEGKFHLELAHAQSNKAPKGRKSDFRDAERLWRRYDADELILSFVPDPEQRIWRMQSRTRIRLTQDKARLQNRLEALLEEMGIKLSEIVSDLLGVSGQRILRGIASGESNPEVLAAMADRHLRATKGELCEAFEVVKKLDPRYLVVLQQFLDRLELNEKHSEELKAELAKSLKPHEAAVERVAEIPGMGPDSAQQVIAEVGPKAERFESAAALCSWTGVTPGENVSAGKSHGDRCPKGNMALRRVLNQAANATVKAKGTVFEAHYKRIVGRDPRKHFTAIGAVVHKLEAVIWKVLHDGVRYEERGKRQNPEADRRRAVRLTRELKRLGYDVVPKAVSTPVGG